MENSLTDLQHIFLLHFSVIAKPYGSDEFWVINATFYNLWNFILLARLSPILNSPSLTELKRDIDYSMFLVRSIFINTIYPLTYHCKLPENVPRWKTNIELLKRIIAWCLPFLFTSVNRLKKSKAHKHLSLPRISFPHGSACSINGPSFLFLIGS